MMNKLIRKTLLGAALLALLPLTGLQAETRFDQILGADTAFYLETPDLPRTLERWEDSPIGKAWAGGQLDAIKTFFTENEDFKEATAEAEESEAFQHLLGMRKYFTGQAAIAMVDLTPFMEGVANEVRGNMGAAEEESADADEDGVPDFVHEVMAQFVFMADIGDQAEAFQKDLTEMNAKGNEEADNDETETYIESKEIDGRTVHFMKVNDADAENPIEVACWTFVDSVLVMTYREAQLLGLAEALASGAASEPLQSNLDYAESRARMENPDGVIYFNLKPVGTFIDKVLRDLPPPDPAANAGNPMGMQIIPEQIAAALELDAMAPMFASMQMNPEGVRFVGMGGFSRETKLSRILLPSTGKSYERPKFVPAKLVSVSSARFELNAWWSSVEDLLTAISPQMGAAVMMGKGMAAQQLGVDLQTGVLDLIGDSLVYGQMIGEAIEDAPPTSGFLIGIAVRDKDAIQNSISTISSKLGQGEDMVKTRELMGHTVYSFTEDAAPGQPQVGYTFLDNYLVLSVGTLNLLPEAIRTFEDPSTSMWQSEAFQRISGKIPEGAEMIEYTEFESLAKSWKKVMEMQSQVDMDAEEMPDIGPVIELMDGAISSARLEGSRMVTEGVMLYKQGGGE